MPTPGSEDGFLKDFLADHHTSSMDLHTVVARCASAMGFDQAVPYLVDVQQRRLFPVTDDSPPLLVDASLAGWAYRTQSLRVEESAEGRLTAWLPLIDGGERLGVLAVHVGSLDAARLRGGRAVAALLAMMISSQRAYRERYVQLTRTEPMELNAEMLRAFLPPRTISNDRVVSTAVLEPAYDVGGDAYDHALTTTGLHAAILDSMGHDLASGLTTAVALAACRRSRHIGSDLPELVGSVDTAIATWLPDRFCTGVLTQLNVSDGTLRWCNCGHPPPLLIRDGRLIEGALERPADPPMGLASLFVGESRTVHEAVLRPGDRVLLYTDGVTETRTPGAAGSSVFSFTDSIVRATNTGELAPEALRRLSHSILDDKSGRLHDDATILMIEWLPPED